MMHALRSLGQWTIHYQNEEAIYQGNVEYDHVQVHMVSKSAKDAKRWQMDTLEQRLAIQVLFIKTLGSRAIHTEFGDHLGCYSAFTETSKGVRWAIPDGKLFLSGPFSPRPTWRNFSAIFEKSFCCVLYISSKAAGGEQENCCPSPP
jgi:hypothetical protein